MFNIGDQLSESFEELMAEIRAMHREMERIRKLLEEQTAAARSAKPVRSARATHTASRPTRKSAA